MQLHVIATGSKGNCYVLQAENGERLIIEAGIRADLLKQAIDFDLESVSGVIISHEHADHSRAAYNCCSWGLEVYATEGTWMELRGIHPKSRVISHGQQILIGAFKVIPFDVKHDANEPVGFLINHEECGKVLFVTDAYYVRQKFRGLNNIIIEANYCEKIINEKMGLDSDRKFLRDRIMQSHFSLQNCLGLLNANDLSQVNNIVLIHLSDGNSDEKRFKSEVEQATGKNVTVASNGMKIGFNKQPF